jgi:hypothetical protein
MIMVAKLTHPHPTPSTRNPIGFCRLVGSDWILCRIFWHGRRYSGNFLRTVWVVGNPTYHWIELTKLHVEHDCNSSNMFLNEYGKVLGGRFHHSLSKKGSILGIFH